jgi:glycosyltransferase involved in cell wall biosynthesis
MPVYRKYNESCHYVSISDADRSPRLQYTATVHHGIDIDRFTFRDHYGDYLVFFGRIHHDKGAKEAIEISQHCGMKLVMAGIIQDAEYYRRYVEPHLDGIHVAYVGSVGPEKRNQLLGQARALLHPINFAEPFGLSVVEAMACGTPVIAFNKGSMPEIISSGVDGFLVENVEQAVAAVKRLGDIDRTRCRQAVEKRFTVERMAQKYARVYEGILGMSSG